MLLADIADFDWASAAIGAMAEFRSARRLAWALPVFATGLLCYALGWPRAMAQSVLTLAGVGLLALGYQHVQWSLEQIPIQAAEADETNARMLSEEFGVSVSPEDTSCMQTLAKRPTMRCVIPSADGSQNFLVTSVDGVVALTENR